MALERIQWVRQMDGRMLYVVQIKLLPVLVSLFQLVKEQFLQAEVSRVAFYVVYIKSKLTMRLNPFNPSNSRKRDWRLEDIHRSSLKANPENNY